MDKFKDRLDTWGNSAAGRAHVWFGRCKLAGGKDLWLDACGKISQLMMWYSYVGNLRTGVDGFVLSFIVL